MLARKSLLHFLNTVVGAILGLVALKLIALYMGDSLLGQVAYAMSLVGLLYGLLQLGLPGAHKKRLSEPGDRGDKLATYVVLRTGLTLLMVALVFGFVVVWTFVLGKRFVSTSMMTLLIMVVYFAIKAVQDVGNDTFQARRHIARSQTAVFGNDLVRTVGAALAAITYAGVRDVGPLAGVLGPEWAWLEPLGAELLALTYLLGALCGAAISFWYVVQDYSFGGFRRDIVGSYWAFAAPNYLAGIVGLVASRLDRAMLGFFWSDSTVGIYFGADRIASILNSVGFALAAVLLPTVSYMSEEEDREGVADVLGRSHRYSSMVILPAVLFLAVFADPVIRLILSAKFLASGPVLILLAIYTQIFVLYRVYSSGIGGVDRPILNARSSAAMAATNIVLDLVLIPADIKSLGIELAGLGAVGAAIATLASGVVGYAIARYDAGRLIPLRRQWPHLGRQLVAGMVMVGFLYALDTYAVDLVRWFHLLAFVPLGLAVYVGAMAAIGEFTRTDWDFFIDLIHPAEMWEYVREELFPSRRREEE